MGDLFLSPHHGLPDHLANIPKEDHINFLCSLFYNILIDQVMFTHHPEDYWKFRLLTFYPKMDRTLGWARTLMMANPYELFSEEVIKPRSIHPDTLLEKFDLWAKFIIKDSQKYFDKHNLGTTSWGTVRDSMLNDPDCTRGVYYGETLRLRLLEEG